MAKKSSSENKEAKSKIQEALDRLNKSYGSGTVLSLNDKARGTYDVISSGSIVLDYSVLGIGGFAKGKLYELMGWEGTGKSTICGHAVAECQRKGGVALYIDGEHAVDKEYFQALGVDIDKMLLAQPTTGEEGFNVALELINTGDIDLVIIDSDSSLLPQKVIEGEIGDSAIGKKAVLNNNAYPKLKTALSANNVCVIVISQFREKIGVMFGNPTTTQGGHALKFYSDCRMEISKSLAKDDITIYGNITKLKTIKNKMYPPYKTGSFEIVYGIGIDKVGELVELLDEYELGKKYGSSFTIDGKKMPLEDFKNLVTDNPDYYEELKLKVLDKMKNVGTTEEIFEQLIDNKDATSKSQEVTSGSSAPEL